MKKIDANVLVAFLMVTSIDMRDCDGMRFESLERAI